MAFADSKETEYPAHGGHKSDLLNEQRRCLLRALSQKALQQIENRIDKASAPQDAMIYGICTRLNWQFVDDLGGLVYRLMCRIARDGHDGSHCADHAHWHGDQFGEQTTG